MEEKKYTFLSIYAISRKRTNRDLSQIKIRLDVTTQRKTYSINSIVIVSVISVVRIASLNFCASENGLHFLDANVTCDFRNAVALHAMRLNSNFANQLLFEIEANIQN